MRSPYSLYESMKLEMQKHFGCYITPLRYFEQDFPFQSNFAGSVKVLKTFQQHHHMMLERIANRKKTILLKLEDLHLNLNSEIQKVADFLGIDFQDSLLASTMAGEVWHGNSGTREKKTVNDKSTIERWRKNLTAIEIRAISRTQAPTFQQLQYPISSAPFNLNEVIRFIRMYFQGINYQDHVVFQKIQDRPNLYTWVKRLARNGSYNLARWFVAITYGIGLFLYSPLVLSWFILQAIQFKDHQHE